MTLCALHQFWLRESKEVGIYDDGCQTVGDFLNVFAIYSWRSFCSDVSFPLLLILIVSKFNPRTQTEENEPYFVKFDRSDSFLRESVECSLTFPSACKFCFSLEFLKFVAHQEECRKKWLKAEEQFPRLRQEITKSKVCTSITYYFLSMNQSPMSLQQETENSKVEMYKITWQNSFRKQLKI